jgi:hypothetical protein
MKRALVTLLILTGFILSTTLAQGESGSQDEMSTLKQENAQLRQRVEKLESALSEIQNMLATQPPAVTEEKTEKETPALQTKYGVELYGYIKLDGAYDSARVDSGNYARWVLPEEDHEHDKQWSETARETRLGLLFHGPDQPNLKTSGRLEIDFYGGGDENKNTPMLRHAYLQLDWPDNDFSILAGQTSDVISPLYPTTLNYTVAWWAGNIGYRRPQFRLTKGYNLGQDYRLLLQAAASRTIGRNNLLDESENTGVESGFPTLQGRVALTFPFLTSQKATVGISGHWGQEEFDLHNTGHEKDVDSWSANLDVTLPLREWLILKGEFYTGSDLDNYLGGIAQGVTGNAAGAPVNEIEGIDDTGGWVALSFGPFGRWRYNLGASIDDPDNGDLASGSRSRNSAIWVNAIFDVNAAVQAGIEISRWETDYIDLDDGDAYRIETSLIYRF